MIRSSHRELKGYDRIFRRRLVQMRELRAYQDEIVEVIELWAKLLATTKRS
jgi:hypothetical protein